MLPSISALLNVYSGLKFHHFSKKNVHEIFPKFPLKEKENKKTRVFYRYLEEI